MSGSGEAIIAFFSAFILLGVASGADSIFILTTSALKGHATVIVR